MKNRKLTYFFILNLGLIGGATDIISLLLAGTFSGHLTGNSVLFIFHFNLKNYSQTIIDLIAILCFIIASTIGMLLISLKQRSKTILTLLVELILIAVAFIIKINMEHFIANCLCIGLLSFALGLQNGSFLKVISPIHTSYITGTVTSFLQLIVTKNRNFEQNQSLKITALTIFGFLIGAIIGSYLGIYLEKYSLFISIFLIIINLILSPIIF